jgi:hypothetical protein
MRRKRIARRTIPGELQNLINGQVVAEEWMPRRRYQRSDSREQLDRGECAVGRPFAGVLDRVGDAAVGQHREPLEREGRPRAVADQLLARDVVVSADADGGVEVEAVEQRRLAVLPGGGLVVIVTSRAASEIDEEAALRRELGAARERVGLGLT